jgi:hypothetical protein
MLSVSHGGCSDDGERAGNRWILALHQVWSGVGREPARDARRVYGVRRAHAWACVRGCRVMAMTAVAGDVGLTLLMVLALPAGILLVGAPVALFVRLVIEIAAAS